MDFNSNGLQCVNCPHPQDLLTTVNTPEWPAAELLLSLLGKLLVSKFANKKEDVS